MNALKELIKISKYAGERFDLVQAGGGNASVKNDDGTMLIKASGFLLSEVNEETGIAKVYTQKIADILGDSNILEVKEKTEREAISKILVKEATIDDCRPSIETLLHAFLSKYTLHTHPLTVNMIVIQKEWKHILNSIFVDMILVDYKTPGIELALALKKAVDLFMASTNKQPKIIFLQNHGLIITSDNLNEIMDLSEEVLNKIEKYLNVDFSRYRATTFISNLFSQFKDIHLTSYLSEDTHINNILQKKEELLFSAPFSPDKLVYCGISAVKIARLNDINAIKRYREKYFDLPKIIIFKSRIYIIADNIRKAKEIEDVLKFHLLVLENIDQKINFLESDELAYLSNWEAEKYRQKI